MSNFIEEFYYGNHEPQEMNTFLTSKVKENHRKLTDKEETIRNMLSGKDLKLFEEYVDLQRDFICVSCSDSFISGFKYGAKFTYDTFVDN